MKVRDIVLIRQSQTMISGRPIIICKADYHMDVNDHLNNHFPLKCIENKTKEKKTNNNNNKTCFLNLHSSIVMYSIILILCNFV